MAQKQVHQELEPWKRDQRFLFWKAKQDGLTPASGDAEAFAERVAIKMADAFMDEDHARLSAYQEWKAGLSTISVENHAA